MEKSSRDKSLEEKDRYQEHSDAEPSEKVKKPNIDISESDLTINENIFNMRIADKINKNWSKKNLELYQIKDLKIISKPFQVGVIQNFYRNAQNINKIINEMILLDWKRKQMDLFEFYQSVDLHNISTPYLKSVLHTLEYHLLPWVSKACKVHLTHVSASCSMYNCGDYLLPHDDLYTDRQVAFILYLSPWDKIKSWTNEMGGSLDLFESDSKNLPLLLPTVNINPVNNQFIFFKVGSKSFHQVAEVTNLDYPRLTINGWFHGTTNNKKSEIISMENFISPNNASFNLKDWINLTYLTPDSKLRIQEYVEENSEVSLQLFFNQSKFNILQKELNENKNLKWLLKGPANRQNYDILDLNHLEGPLNNLINIFGSLFMFELLYEYTGLDFFGKESKTPKFNLEIQKWHKGCYTLLEDSNSVKDSVLEVSFYLNDLPNICVMHYVSSDKEDSENLMHEGKSKVEYDKENSTLLTIYPKSNTLNMVYNCGETMRFTKYVSRLNIYENGNVYVVFCKYKE